MPLKQSRLHSLRCVVYCFSHEQYIVLKAPSKLLPSLQIPFQTKAWLNITPALKSRWFREQECVWYHKSRNKVHQTKCFCIAVALQKSKDRMNAFRNISTSCDYSEPGSSLCPLICELDSKSRYRWKDIYICTLDNICAILRSVLTNFFDSFYPESRQNRFVRFLFYSRHKISQYLLYKFYKLSDIHQIYKRNGLCHSEQG